MKFVKDFRISEIVAFFKKLYNDFDLDKFFYLD